MFRKSNLSVTGRQATESEVVISTAFLAQGVPSKAQATEAELWGVLQTGSDWHQALGASGAAAGHANEAPDEEEDEAQSDGGSEGEGSGGSFRRGSQELHVHEGVPLHNLSAIFVLAVAVGDGHAVFVSRGGQAFAVGRNDRGQLGLCDHNVRCQPTMLPPLRAMQVAADAPGSEDVAPSSAPDSMANTMPPGWWPGAVDISPLREPSMAKIRGKAPQAKEVRRSPAPFAVQEDPRPNTEVPPGYKLLSEAERLESLSELRGKLKELNNRYSRLPLKIETEGQRQQQKALTEKILETERAESLFSRRTVLVEC
ncbi:unnamed protein product [Polarella glacialis]|uniref:Enkurin domain-containing protein n=1 Tax=Polarella glacialis TaxID=89957 RepID=A0A813JSB5_POLGL|nr:unnamed protein product [Polarella glacialis]